MINLVYNHISGVKCETKLSTRYSLNFSFTLKVYNLFNDVLGDFVKNIVFFP